MRTRPRTIRRPAIVLATLTVAAAGCGALPFDVGQDLPEQRVQGSPNPIVGLLPGFLQVPLTVDIKAETARRDTGPAHSAVLKELTLAATPHAAPSGNFDFLDEVHISVAAPSSASLPRREIARLVPAPRGVTRVTFEVIPDVDLLPYIDAGAEITSSATGRQPVRDVTFDGHVTVTVRF